MNSSNTRDPIRVALRELHWPLVVGLGGLALARPLIRIAEDQLGVTGSALVPILASVAISVVWIAVVGLGRVSRPVLTLVAAGLVYGLASIVLGGILSPILTGQLQGPLAMPLAIVPVLLINALWGLITGALAAALQRVRR